MKIRVMTYIRKRKKNEKENEVIGNIHDNPELIKEEVY
jgi:hypothetical protein